MKRIILALVFVFLSLQTGNVTAQSAAQPRWNVASWEPGLGMVFRHEEGFSAARLLLGTRNLFIKNRVGVYYILEYRGGIKFIEDATSFYFRDLLGINYSINKNFSVHGAVGVFRKGILLDGDLRGGGYYWSNLQHGRLRKELGITYRIPEYPISVDIAYSFWVGPTATFGYIIPMNEKKLGNAPLKSIPVYDVPVFVETKPENPIVTEDSVINKPVYTNVETPKFNDSMVVFDTLETKPIYSETQPTVSGDSNINDTISLKTRNVKDTNKLDLMSLAQRSTTYYPFNVSELNDSNKETLESLIRFMKQNPSSKVIVYGNADRLGSESYNLSLSASRAKNVKSYLINQGISSLRIKVVANGEIKAKGETDEERALNRCVEFSLQMK